MADWDTALSEQLEFSKRTFGPDFRPKGIVDHIRKECDEIDSDPYDDEEWIDILVLGFDGLLKKGNTPEEIYWKYVAKTAKNRARKWPKWEDSDPDKAIEHVRDDE